MMRIRAEWLTGDVTQKVCAMLTQAGFQAFAVGGCVRNELLGVAISDIDIASDAWPETVSDLAVRAGFKPVATGIEHGTITVVAQGQAFEITTFRKDVETDGRRAVVAFADTIEEDAHRRDFTMNALYARPDGTVVDPLGGLEDLRRRKVRFIDDPRARIREDYLRILRFFRFHAWYGDPLAGLDREGLAACAELAGGLERLSRERVGSEMMKLLGAPDPAPAVAAMAQAGVLGRVLPGASAGALAVLVALEAESGRAPDPVRRLVCLGGEGQAERLRLSKAQKRRIETLRRGIESPAGARELGYREGVLIGGDILLLRAALSGQPVPPGSAAMLEQGSHAVFPLTSADLMAGFQGPALGRELKAREARWIASGFTLGREELLE